METRSGEKEFSTYGRRLKFCRDRHCLNFMLQLQERKPKREGSALA
jgi:hypothetical protein